MALLQLDGNLGSLAEHKIGFPQHKAQCRISGWTTRMITACIIAKDEGKVIGRCLESIKDLCEEVCILDTGSTDDTKAIASQFGAQTRFQRM